MTCPHFRHASWIVCLALAIAGCGERGPSLVWVTGTITLDGRPLPNAVVHFTPVAGGRGSYARADGNGRYALEFLPGRPGATAGAHRVSISTADESGNFESVPARYSRESELEATVQPGAATIDFQLTTP
jgi:hypothetical protein